MNTLMRKLQLEALRVSRFGVVGAAATATHLLIVAFFIITTAIPTLAANTLAFLAAFGVSLAGHYVWTFQKPVDLRRAAGRFMLVSVSAFACNTLVLAFALEAGWLSPLPTAILAVGVIPVITYSASRLWAFRVGES